MLANLPEEPVAEVEAREKSVPVVKELVFPYIPVPVVRALLVNTKADEVVPVVATDEVCVCDPVPEVNAREVAPVLFPMVMVSATAAVPMLRFVVFALPMLMVEVPVPVTAPEFKVRVPPAAFPPVPAAPAVILTAPPAPPVAAPLPPAPAAKVKAPPAPPMPEAPATAPPAPPVREAADPTPPVWPVTPVLAWPAEPVMVKMFAAAAPLPATEEAAVPTRLNTSWSSRVTLKSPPEMSTSPLVTRMSPAVRIRASVPSAVPAMVTLAPKFATPALVIDHVVPVLSVKDMSPAETVRPPDVEMSPSEVMAPMPVIAPVVEISQSEENTATVAALVPVKTSPKVRAVLAPRFHVVPVIVLSPTERALV